MTVFIPRLSSRFVPVLGLMLWAPLWSGCGGLGDFDKYLDSGQSDGPGGSNELGDDVVDTGLTGGSGDGGSGDGGTGDDGAGESGAGDDGTDDGGSGDDGSVDPIDIAVDTVTPDFGSNAGGDVVTITGGPFDASVSVEIFGAEATISSITETELIVVTPAVPRSGPSSVVIASDLGSGRMANAFRYWEDAAGQYGMIGIVEMSRYTGGYWEGGVTPDDLFGAAVYFSNPTEVRWHELITPTLDTCRTETWTATPSVTVFDPGIAQIDLEPISGSTLQLTYDGVGFSGEPTSLTAGASYDLLAPGGILPAEDVPSVVRLPSRGPVVSSPAISSTMPPSIGQYQSFSWTSSGADWVLISMILDNGMTSDGWEVVSCAVYDDGSFNFDGSQFSLWARNTTAIVSVAFVYDQSTTALPWNRGTSAIAGVVATVGGGITY